MTHPLTALWRGNRLDTGIRASTTALVIVPFSVVIANSLLTEQVGHNYPHDESGSRGSVPSSVYGADAR